MEQMVQPVDVISLCSADGDIRPIRLRVASENQLLRVDILRILQIRDVPRPGGGAKIFFCRGKIGVLECDVELKYSIRCHSWVLLRKTF